MIEAVGKLVYCLDPPEVAIEHVMMLKKEPYIIALDDKNTAARLFTNAHDNVVQFFEDDRKETTSVKCNLIMHASFQRAETSITRKFQTGLSEELVFPLKGIYPMKFMHFFENGINDLCWQLEEVMYGKFVGFHVVLDSISLFSHFDGIS